MAPSPTIRRLLKETSELSASSKNPNPAFYAAPVSDNDLHEWHFTLLGPPSPSPYAGGLYHGRISLPPSYPLKPPNFRFLTPSGRFEVNREICLSISGFHEETWMPAWGVRTALTALRSFMAESGTAGQVGGLESPKEVRERLAKESRSWKCNECGGRTNEEVMKEWWEICADKGVRVGEDVGLEVLPEGLSLEAKTPGSAGTDKNNSGPKGKGKEEAKHEQVVAATTQAILHNSASDTTSPGLQTSPTTTSVPNTTTTVTDPTTRRRRPSSLSQPRSPSPNDPTISTRNPTPLPLPTPTSTDPSPMSKFQSQPQTQSPASARPIPAGLRPLPLVTPPISRTQRRQQEEQTIVTIDRAIYVVCLALCIMVLKKIFYPATSATDWEEFGLVRE